jgi:hypothetical protein
MWRDLLEDVANGVYWLLELPIRLLALALAGVAFAVVAWWRRRRERRELDGHPDGCKCYCCEYEEPPVPRAPYEARVGGRPRGWDHV